MHRIRCYSLWLAALLLGWASAPRAGHAQTCVDGVACVEAVPNERGVAFQVYNRSERPIYVTIAPELINLKAEVSLPHTQQYPPGGPYRAFEVRAVQNGQRWGYGYQFNYRPAWKRDEDCREDLCVIREQRGDELAYLVENRRSDTVSLQFRMRPQNVRFGVPFPYLVVVPPAGTVRAFEGVVTDPIGAWSSGVSWRWAAGDAEARHNNGYVYTLPYDVDRAYRIDQGYNGAFSHRGKYALDFNLARGDAVRAAREGIVVATEAGYGDGKPEETYRDRSNYVHVRHADGTLGVYTHLERGTIAVRPGERVRRGQLLGQSGNSGYSSGPHLHFEVRRLTPDLTTETVPVRFQTARGIEMLEEGGVYEQR